jgi:hypothetical protein
MNLISTPGGAATASAIGRRYIGQSNTNCRLCRSHGPGMGFVRHYPFEAGTLRPDGTVSCQSWERPGTTNCRADVLEVAKCSRTTCEPFCPYNGHWYLEFSADPLLDCPPTRGGTDSSRPVKVAEGLHSLKSSPDTRNIPIVMVSGTDISRVDPTMWLCGFCQR